VNVCGVVSSGASVHARQTLGGSTDAVPSRPVRGAAGSDVYVCRLWCVLHFDTVNFCKEPVLRDIGSSVHLGHSGVTLAGGWLRVWLVRYLTTLYLLLVMGWDGEHLKERVVASLIPWVRQLGPVLFGKSSGVTMGWTCMSHGENKNYFILLVKYDRWEENIKMCLDN
jgi:hypothetical protein